MRILHVKDDDTFRKWLKQGLKESGFAVNGSYNAKDFGICFLMHSTCQHCTIHVAAAPTVRVTTPARPVMHGVTLTAKRAEANNRQEHSGGMLL